MRPSRARGGLVARTLTRRDIEERLDTLIRRSGEDAARRLRDEVRAVASDLGMQDEASELDARIGSLLGTRHAGSSAPAVLARRRWRPYVPALLRHRASRRGPFGGPASLGRG